MENMTADKALNPLPVNPCCAEWNIKCSKLLKSRNALREAVKIIERSYDDVKAQNDNLNKVYQEELARAKIEKEEKLKEFNAKVSLENEVSALKSEITALQQKCDISAQEENGDVKALQADISDKEKEIDRLKKLVEKEKKRADSERKVAENEKKKAENGDVKALQADLSDKEKEIDRLKKLVEKEKKRADSAREVAENEKKKEENGDVKALQADISDKEKEIDRLKKLVEKEKKRADSERRVAENEKKKEENEDVKTLQADISDKVKEIDRLKKLVEKEKKRADSERKVAENEKKKAAEAYNLLEAEKKISVDKGVQLSKIEAEKAEEYRVQRVHLEKEVTDTKMKLASELLKFKEASKRVEAEKQKLLVEKRNAESKMKKAQEQVEVEKQKTAREKRRADEEHVKVEEQKKLAEDNRKSAMEAKRLADQMSQELVEDKKTIENLKQKIHELSSLRKPNEISGVSPDALVNAESDKIQLLKSNLELEKLRAKHAREKLKHERKKFEHERMKFKYEESCRSILQHELNRLKLDFIQNYNHLTMLDASFSPVTGSIHGLTKSQNMPSMQKSDVMTQLGNLGMPQMHCVENELTKPCSIRFGACDSLQKSMQNTPLLAISEGNYTKPITGIGSKLEPLIGGSNRTMIQSYAVNSSTESFSDAHLMGSQERGALQVTASTKSSEENFNARAGMLNPSDRSVIGHDGIRNRISDTIECVANLSSEGKKLNMQLEDKLSDLCGLLYDEMNESVEGGREMVTNRRENLQAENARAHKKRKISHREQAGTSVDEKKETQEPKAGVYEDADGPRQTTCLGPSDTIECVANLSSEGKKLNMQLEDKLSDLCGLLYDEMNESVEGGREVVTNRRENLQAENARAHKKRKISHREQAGASVDEKKETQEPKAGVYEDADGPRQTTCPALYTQTTQVCRERIFDASNNFDEIYNGNIRKLFEFENVVDEECYGRVGNEPLSPLFSQSSHEIETFALDNMEPFQDEFLHTDLLNQIDLSPVTSCDVIDVEIISNVQKVNAFTVPCNAHKSTQAIQTDVKLQDINSLEYLRDTFLVETGAGSLHHQLPNFGLVVSDREDNSSISRTLFAARNCIARCSLNTQTEWAVASILTAVEMEEISPKEKHSVLLTLLVFNFTTTTMKFGKFGGGNLIHCLNSYAKHIRRVMMDADTGVLLLKKISLLELLRLIEDFLIEGKVMLKNIVPSETSSDSDLRNDSIMDGVDALCSEEATSEQLVAASIILASLCVATDYIGFISEASYNILRLCRRDSLMVITILHIFANLGGTKYFDSGSYGLMVTVLKSLVMFLEEESISVATASFLPSINQLHTEICSNGKCPFSEGSESIDVVTLLLLEKIKKHLFQQAEPFDSDNYSKGQWSNQEVVPCTNSINCDVPCCLKKHVACPTQPDVLIDVTLCQLSDILSLLELVANKMRWQWTNTKLVPQLLHILDSCTVENAVVAIIVLLGQLGRLGVDVGGYEDQGVENLRCKLLSYLCNSSVKAGQSLQIATATALFGLLPLDLEALLLTERSLPAYSSKSISDDAGNLRKWFSGLGEHQRDLLCGILRCTD